MIFRSFVHQTMAICGGFLAVAACLTGEIRETASIQEALDLADTKTLVLLNIAGTLYEPINTLSDHDWRLFFEQHVHQLLGEGPHADQIINKVKYDIVTRIPKRSVEDVTPKIIATLQQNKIPVLGLTRKSPQTDFASNFGEITSSHLRSLGIDLERTFDYLTIERNIQEDRSYYLLDGIIFTVKQSEGPAIVSLIKSLLFSPERLIVVDNNQNSLVEIEKAIVATGIDFRGFRYTAKEKKKLVFDPILGIIQLFEFYEKGALMSDEEALKIKATQSDEAFINQLDEYIMRQ